MSVSNVFALPLSDVPAAEPPGASAPGGDAASGRDVQVTRPGSLTGETRPDKGPIPVWGSDQVLQRLYPGSPVPFFIDWLSISQVHFDVPSELDADGFVNLEGKPGPLPIVQAGAVWVFDEDGELEVKTCKHRKHEGSHDTCVAIRCDGYRVSFSGNVSRFGRPDNVWGFSFAECLERINAILAHYFLPPFSAGDKFPRQDKFGRVTYAWTGARVSRIDVTSNFLCGSAADLHHVMQWLGTQQDSRRGANVYGDGETVYFGQGSKRQSWKAYDKAKELERHGCSDPKLIDYCKSKGLLRWEGTVRSNALTDMGAAYLGDYEEGWAMAQLFHIHQQRTAIFSRAEFSTDQLDELPRSLRATARDYLAGQDVFNDRSQLSRATAYRHRKELLKFGIDIAVRNVTPFKPRTVQVKLVPAEVPSWYQLAA